MRAQKWKTTKRCSTKAPRRHGVRRGEPRRTWEFWQRLKYDVPGEGLGFICPPDHTITSKTLENDIGYVPFNNDDTARRGRWDKVGVMGIKTRIQFLSRTSRPRLVESVLATARFEFLLVSGLKNCCPLIVPQACFLSA